MPGFIIFSLFLLLVAGFIVISSLYVVKQQSVAIIERFGRYPHRNEALKRKATAEEQEFLQSPGSSFW